MEANIDKLVDGDDQILVAEVGSWAPKKHRYLMEYIRITSDVRAMFTGRGKAGATYIDLFCGPGRSKIRTSNTFIPGSCVSAWEQSVATGRPFSQMFIADADPERRAMAAERLKRLKAPVIEIEGDALTAARAITRAANPKGLHFAFLDPYNLGNCSFEVLRELAKLERIDMLVHVSKMDLQRNVGLNIASQEGAFDIFAPGWRQAVDLKQPHTAIRRAVFDYWRREVAKLKVTVATEMKLISGSKNQPLYWLTLIARHNLALKFWKAIVKAENPQLGLF